MGTASRTVLTAPLIDCCAAITTFVLAAPQARAAALHPLYARAGSAAETCLVRLLRGRALVAGACAACLLVPGAGSREGRFGCLCLVGESLERCLGLVRRQGRREGQAA